MAKKSTATVEIETLKQKVTAQEAKIANLVSALAARDALIAQMNAARSTKYHVVGVKKQARPMALASAKRQLQAIEDRKKQQGGALPKSVTPEHYAALKAQCGVPDDPEVATTAQ